MCCGSGRSDHAQLGKARESPSAGTHFRGLLFLQILIRTEACKISAGADFQAKQKSAQVNTRSGEWHEAIHRGGLGEAGIVCLAELRLGYGCGAVRLRRHLLRAHVYAASYGPSGALCFERVGTLGPLRRVKRRLAAHLLRVLDLPPPHCHW